MIYHFLKICLINWKHLKKTFKNFEAVETLRSNRDCWLHAFFSLEVQNQSSRLSNKYCCPALLPWFAPATLIHRTPDQDSDTLNSRSDTCPFWKLIMNCVLSACSCTSLVHSFRASERSRGFLERRGITSALTSALKKCQENVDVQAPLRRAMEGKNISGKRRTLASCLQRPPPIIPQEFTVPPPEQN